ncbi:MAG: sigma-70 family RNA polymerase sigma factor [Bacteroidetes bacterium]|nr:sigma-70 family RNA polymerase sigma factor [Bacteroidota bacterium]
MSIELYSDNDLIIGCLDSKRQYQEILYRRFAKKMYGVCLSYAGDRDFAMDILQESFIKVFNKIDSFKNEGSLEGWIRRIVVNTAIDLIRQRKNIDKHLKEEIVEHQGYIDSNILPRLQLQELVEFIKKLPEGARVIFNLFAMEGYTHKQIAEELHISEGTSKSQYNRARGLLKNWLAEIYERR